MKKKHCLVGKTIYDILVDKDGDAILFRVTEGGDVVAECYADCCSTTWIEHIELPFKGFPVLVLAVSDLEMPSPEYDNSYNLIQFYGLKISTDKGEIVIEYRNSSNGYYGGDLIFLDEDGGYIPSHNVGEYVWVPVKEKVNHE